MFKITIDGPRAVGKTTFIHRHLLPALRDAGFAAEFSEDDGDPDMLLTGRYPAVKVIERHDNA
jgi:predicted AAA+ superfamily ATPase